MSKTETKVSYEIHHGEKNLKKRRVIKTDDINVAQKIYIINDV